MKEKNAEKLRIVGLNIAYYRRLNHMSQLQLAELAGISRTHISNIEAPNTDTSISLSVLFDIADALGIPPAKLITFDK